MSYQDETAMNHKTGRIALVCGLILCLGLLFVGTQTESCEGCNDPAGTCHDQFYEIDKGHSQHTCPPHSRAEIVTSPPAPKPGVFCHCLENDRQPQAAPSK